MTTARITGGGVLHFPPYGTIADSVSVIEPPPADTLPDIAAAVHPAELLLFSRRLVQAARKRHRNPRWQKVNRSRVALARLCLDRALADWSAAMPAMPQQGGDDGPDEADDLDEATCRDLVGEAFHTHGEEAARVLAHRLGVPFEACGEAIERLERRPS